MYLKAMNKKKCFYCGSKRTKKNGSRNGVQTFKCNDCQRQFLGGIRIQNQELWHEYSNGKQTYGLLADKYGVSIKNNTTTA